MKHLRHSVLLAAAIETVVAFFIVGLVIARAHASDRQIWRAVLVIFTTSETQPMSMVMGPFPKLYSSEGDCKQFIESRQSAVDTVFETFNATVSGTPELVHLELTCVADGDGQPL